MNDQPIHGVLPREDTSHHPDYLFRISLKAVIINHANQVLVVKEAGRDWWDIPGGGLDHGESVKDALARELYEEVGYEGSFDYQTILIEDPRLNQKHRLYQTRVTFVVTPENYNFRVGEDSDEIMYINPDEFKDSDLITERKIYEYSQLALERLRFARS